MNGYRTYLYKLTGFRECFDRVCHNIGDHNTNAGYFFHGSILLVVTLGHTSSWQNASAY